MSMRVDKHGTKHLITILENQSLEEAYTLMLRNSIRHLPVLNDEGEVAGILSERDLLRAMRCEVNGEGQARNEDRQFPAHARISDYMSWPVKTVDRETPLRSVCHRMIREKISCFLVTEKKNVVGIITTEDLMRILEDLLKDPAEDLRVGLTEVLVHPTAGSLAHSLAIAGI